MSTGWIKVKVKDRAALAEGIVGLTLEKGDGAPLPGFSPGAHIDVELPNGLIRQYSLSNAASENHHYRIGVLLDPDTRGGSKSVHEDLHTGSEIRISEPRNHFPLTAEAKHSILFAGGIGITPILCMARALATKSQSFELHYCCRSETKMAYRDEIATGDFASHVHFHFDDEVDEQKLDLEKVLGNPDTNTHIYVCGPKGFMDFVINSAHDFGWREDNIHFEYFSGAHIEHLEGDMPFQVKIASTGQVIDISTEETITQALANNGVDMPVSCEQGICGTCVTRILDGTPDHRDMYFTDAEKEANDQFTPCCSRSKSPCLVLDL
jgi:vanillate O-demethylase ferredoxin subunit